MCRGPLEDGELKFIAVWSIDGTWVRFQFITLGNGNGLMFLR